MESRIDIAPRVREIAPFHVMEVQTAARALEAAGRSVIHMEIGEPDFPTPPQVIAAGQRALAGGDIYYTSAVGLPALRAAIAGDYRRRYGLEISPDRVIVTAGSSAGLLMVLALLLDRDQEVLLADPGYPCNRHFARVLESRAVAVPVGPDTEYQLDHQSVHANWGPQTRAVLIASPSNPTGTVVPAAELRRIADAVQAHDGALIVDEIYLGLSYAAQGTETSTSALATLAGCDDNLFIVSSFSKYFNMTGWRLGWVIAPERCVRDLEKLAQNLYISPATLSQRAALACFQPDTLALLEERRAAFRQRRDFLVPALRRIGFGIPVMPSGGFFVYADSSGFAPDSEGFCKAVLAEAGVAITPGIDFGCHRAERHVRFAYTIEQAKLEEGVARLARYLSTRTPATLHPDQLAGTLP